jgi:flagellar basal-body rod protein FlgG
MALTALQSAASGMSALNTALDITANNLANVNTTGFKASRANFQDLLYVERAQPGVENANGDQRPIGLFVGLGTRVAGTHLDFTQGPPINTGRDLDVAIDGNGFFRVRTQDALGGGVAYTRAGAFTLNSQGELVLASDQGRRLDPAISVPAGATRPIDIRADGRVFVTVPPEIEPTEIGQIQTAVFINPAGLKQVGENLFIPSAASGPAIVGNPGEDNRGPLIPNFLESSNVDPTRELIDMIRTQRAFEMNSNTIRAADDTLKAVAALRR